MPRGVNGTKKTVCNCGSDVGVNSGMCIECRREYGREYYRRKLAANAAKGGPLVPREERGFCLKKKRPPSYTAIVPSQRALDPYVPVAPVLEVGRRIPAPDAPMAEKLECLEWVAYFERNEMLEWARREANLWQEA